MPSNKKFGYFFSCIFFFVSFYFYYKSSFNIFVFIMPLSVCFLVTTLFFEDFLSPLNKFWYKLGIFLGKFTSPLFLGIIFFGLISPIAILRKAFGSDVLKLKKYRGNSYWVDRNPPGPTSDSFHDQF